MPHVTSLHRRLFAFTVAVSLWSGSAVAEDVVLPSNETLPVELAERPATIIIGNPNIADITVQDNTLLMTGKGFGSTNVIVLNDAGETIRDWQVHVIRQDAYGVAVFKAGKRELYSCKADCETSGETSQAASK